MPKVFLENIGIQPLWAKCPFSETDNKVKTLVDISHQELIFMWIAFHQMWDVSSHVPDHSCHRTFTVRIGFFFPQHQPKTGNVEMTKPLRNGTLLARWYGFQHFTVTFIIEQLLKPKETLTGHKARFSGCKPNKTRKRQRGRDRVGKKSSERRREERMVHREI